MRHLFAIALATSQLLDLFIYDLPKCELSDHLVAEHIRVFVDQKVIRLYSHEDGATVSDDILIQSHKEYHIRENGSNTVIRQGWGGVYQIDPDKAVCK